MRGLGLRGYGVLGWGFLGLASACTGRAHQCRSLTHARMHACMRARRYGGGRESIDEQLMAQIGEILGGNMKVRRGLLRGWGPSGLWLRPP